MATSSITANFYTDDPKAANAIVHALFTETSSPRRMPPRSRFEVKHTPAGDKAFFERLRSKLEREGLRRGMIEDLNVFPLMQYGL